MVKHESRKSKKEEWLTPPDLLKKLGDFDLDPCSPIDRPWDTAKKHYTIFDDGLSKEWEGRVWCNPPYGDKVGRWLNKLAFHGNGIALVFARTETTEFFKQVWEKADGVLFVKGRIPFYHASGKKAKRGAGAPSCFIAYGKDNLECIRKCGIPGFLVDIVEQKKINYANLFSTAV